MNKGPWGGANGRGFWKEYFELGYVPYPESMGSSAQTMEYAYDDFCGYQLAKMVGNKHYQDVFSRQMYNYKNVFDKSIGFMRGKGVDGKWQEPFDPLEWGGPFCEGNAWHYTWSVFHDVQGLIDLFGSDEKFTTKIDSVFTLPNVIKPGTYGGVIHEMKEMELANMDNMLMVTNRFNICHICIAMPDNLGKLNIGYVRLLKDCTILQKKDIRVMKTKVVCLHGIY